MIGFSWDERKNRSNISKHGVSFEEAASVFFDVDGILIDDPDHSQQEERFILFGISDMLNYLAIAHCYYDSIGEIRIISARKATSEEIKFCTRRKG